MRVIDTGGIIYIEPLAPGSVWYFGTDFACGDLYEAEELFRAGQAFRPNRVIFLRRPEGTVFEPIPAREGQYFGRPLELDGTVYLLLADFPAEVIRIVSFRRDFAELDTVAELPLSAVTDCNNLFLHGTPLMLTRQGGEHTFEILWPEYRCFPISPCEAFLHRDGNRLVFSEWHEDPAYREEIVVRDFDTGAVTERAAGNLWRTPDGETWLLR